MPSSLSSSHAPDEGVTTAPPHNHKDVDDDPTAPPPVLSKSWAVARQHVPTFTGGKIVHSKVGLPSYSSNTVGGSHDNAPNAVANPQRTHFLLLPVGGDVAIVDTAHGTSLGTLRGQAADSTTTSHIRSGNSPDWDRDDEEDDDNEEMDLDAITSFALSHNDNVVVTCSHNNIMRQYHLARPSPVDRNEGDAASAAQEEGAAAATTTTTTNTTTSLAAPTPSAPAPVAELVRVWGKSGHSLPVTHMEFHLSSVFLATGSVDGTVRVWDGRSPKSSFLTHLFHRPRHVEGAAATIRGSVTALAWYPDHSKLVLAVGRDDGTVAIHNLRKSSSSKNDKDSKAPAAVLADHDSSVTGCAWIPPQSIFVTASRDAVINLWRVSEPSASYTRIHTLPIYEQIEGLAVLRQTPDRDVPAILTAGSKGIVRLWYIEEDGRLQLWKEQEGGIGEERGGYLQMWYHGEYDAALHSCVKEHVVVADAEHNLSFLSLTDSTMLKKEKTLVGHNDDILDIRSLPDARIAVATNSPQIRLFDLATFSCRTLEGHTATVLALDSSPCGRYLASCGKDHQIRLWHVKAERCVAVAVGHAEAVGSVALSRKIGRYEVVGKAAKNGGGSFLVSVSVDRTLKRWNLPGPDELERIASGQDNVEEISLHASTSVRAHEKDINIVTVAPNDSLVATGSQDKTVKVWKASDLSLVATLTGHRRGVWECQFSPFDRILATASGDKTIKLWSLGDYACVRTFQGHTASVLRVRFLNGGLQMASAGADGLVKVWTIRTNECETTMEGHSDKVWALDLVGKGKQIISGGGDSKIILWNDNTVEVEESKRADQEASILADQMLANHLRRKEYAEALEISLERDKPHHALRVFNSIIESEIQKGKDALGNLKKHAASWNEERLVRILGYCREWNTKARNCDVALLVVKAIVSSVPIHSLAAMKGVPELVAGIMTYTERHFDRLDRLYGSSYLLDFALSAMGDLETENDYATWEASSRLVLPPKHFDGRVQVDGKAVVVGRIGGGNESSDEIMTVGDSDSSDDENSVDHAHHSDEKLALPAAAISDRSDSGSSVN